jgi:hypothetical protein
VIISQSGDVPPELSGHMSGPWHGRGRMMPYGFTLMVSFESEAVPRSPGSSKGSRAHA